MSAAIGIEYLTLCEQLAPPAFIEAVAAGGGASVCLGTRPFWGLHEPATRRETKARLGDLGIAVTMADGFQIDVDLPVDDQKDELARKLALAVDFGAPWLNAFAFAPDQQGPRRPDAIRPLLVWLCEQARAAGIGVLVEFMALSHIVSLAEAVRLLDAVDQPNLAILLDTLHLARSGEGPGDVAVAGDRVGYCQICDAPAAHPGMAAYLDEALNDRMIPGEGELPLPAILAALPPGVVISAEVPLRRLREAGVSPVERVRRIVAGSRSVIGLSAALR